MSINKAILIGHLGKDPDVRYVSDGVAVATFSLATTEKGYITKTGTQVPDRTEWHNIVLWRGLAEMAEKYLHKGDKLYVEGKIRTRQYEDQSGITRYVTEVFADSIELLGSPQRRPLPTEPPSPGATSFKQQTSTSSAKQTATQVPMFEPGTTDDLPF